MATDLEAARALLYMAAAKVTANAPDKTKFAAMAKRLATDTGSSIADRALQLHGGYGYLMDYPVERFWRDAPLNAPNASMFYGEGPHGYTDYPALAA